jgi:crossover junction endodeoxyribonuclease RuvC
MYDGLAALLQVHHPDEVALEGSFFGRDAAAAGKLGEARGVLRLALIQAGYETALYSPAEVKKAVAGNGQATKEAVRYMVVRMLKINEVPTSLDASDALAVAICHLHRGPTTRMSAGASPRRPEVEALLRRVVQR